MVFTGTRGVLVAAVDTGLAVVLLGTAVVVFFAALVVFPMLLLFKLVVFASVELAWEETDALVPIAAETEDIVVESLMWLGPCCL